MELKKKVVKSFGLFLAASLFSRGLQFASRIILAWFLLPKEFGLFAIGFFFISVLEVFRSFGFESALIYTKKDAEKAANTIFVIQMLASLVLFALVFLLSGTIGAFFGKSSFEILEIKKIVQALSFILIINSIGSVHAAFLEKKMEFKKRVLPDVVSSIAYFVIALALAAKGFDVWSIVIATIAASITYNILILFASPVRISFKIDTSIGKDLFDFAKYSFQASVLGFVIANLDVAVVGRMLSTEMLGFYSMAATVSVLLPAQLSFAIGKVSFPAYSKIIEERAKVVDAFERSIKYVLLFFLPVAFGIIILAPTFITVVLGQKWESPSMTAAMQILAITGLSRIIASTSSPIISGSGKPKIFVICALIQVVLLAISIVPLTNAFGIVGASIAVSATTCIVAIAYMWFVLKLFSIKKKRIFQSASKIFFSAIIMSDVIIFLQSILGSKTLLNFLLICIAGAITFFSLVAILDKNLLLGLRQDILPKG